MSAPPLSPRGRVLSDVDDERGRQDEKWGEQNHPDGTGPGVLPLDPISAHHGRHTYLEDAPAVDLADAARRACKAAGHAGHDTWRAILLEEVFEALAEDDPARLRTELVQVAAVATQWAEAIDRRTATT